MDVNNIKLGERIIDRCEAMCRSVEEMSDDDFSVTFSINMYGTAMKTEFARPYGLLFEDIKALVDREGIADEQRQQIYGAYGSISKKIRERILSSQNNS
ncbi:MAG: hypothetical protein LBB17_02225 [Puniceicoccales bacterium]|jgi:hypothetical protein|nr:hypothetical protein [Puniceicoccales bacterium]